MKYMDQRGENYIFYEKMNLNPEWEYTRDTMEHRFGQKLKLIFMMTGRDFVMNDRDFHDDSLRFYSERLRFS